MVDFVCPRCGGQSYNVTFKSRNEWLVIDNCVVIDSLLGFEDVYDFICSDCNYDGKDAALSWLETVRKETDVKTH